jgi:invasion protein IalB
MNYRIVSARPLGRALPAAFAAAMLAAAVAVTPALAQQQPQQQPKPAPKATTQQKPAPAKPAAQQKPQQPAQQPPQQQAGAEQLPQLMYSPWTKVCQKGQETDNKEVCIIHKDGRLENGMPVVIAELLEKEGIDKKILRVTVPFGMRLPPGTRIIIDQATPTSAPYAFCLQFGCIAEYDASGDMVAQMKKGQMLTVQAINLNNQPISLPLPLTDFAKALDGPPIDPKALEAQQKKLQEELQKRAEEARKKLEAQQPAAQAPAVAQPR